MFADFPLALSYDDVLLVPQYSQIKSRSEVDLSTNLSPRLKIKLPILSANMNHVTNVKMAIALARLGGLGIIPRFNTANEEADLVSLVKKENLLVGAAIGCKEDYLERAQALVKAGVDALVLDVAHGHMQTVLDTLTNLRKTFPEVTIIAGNVATYEASCDLFKLGTDCVKVGIGPGSICTTRIMTGSGVPQITAILEAARAAKEHNKTIIADGGIKNSGDIVKSLAAGAHSVMLGNLIASSDEAPGEIVVVNNKTYKKYNGSTTLKENHVEGVAGLVPSRGPLSQIIQELVEGIKSGLSYSGAKNILELQDKAKFIRISSQGLRESNAHDVVITN
ncbi:MAG: IMP dehydrogenase [Patescibacteria group bacterium]